MIIRLQKRVQMPIAGEPMGARPKSAADPADALVSRDAEITGVSPEPPFLSLEEAAHWLGISRATLNRLLAAGKITAVRVGKRRKIPAIHLASYVGRGIINPEDIEQNQSYQSSNA